MGSADPGTWLLLAGGTRLAASAAALAVRSRPRAARAAAFGGSALASALTGGVGLLGLAAAAPLRGRLVVHPASGLTLGYSVDALSAFFLVVLALLGVAVAVYSIAYFAHATPARVAFVGTTFNVLMGAVELVFVADGAVGFLLAWELMTLATAALVATEHEHAATRRAAYLFLALSHVGTGALIAGFFVLASGAPSVGFVDILGPHAAALPSRSAVFLLFLVGFGVKAGMIPLHVWLPEAHPAAPSPISALMSGVLIKTGIYGVVRVCVAGLGPPPLAWGGVVLGLGAVSMLLGVLYALTEHDLKRLLAYHSIENIGIILMAARHRDGRDVARPADAWRPSRSRHRSFTSSTTPSSRGCSSSARGPSSTPPGRATSSEMGGLIRRMPWTAGFFLIGAMAISGLPSLNGFVSEWLVFQSLLLGFHTSSDAFVRVAFPIGGALLALTDRPRGGVLREGVRHSVPGTAAQCGGGRGARVGLARCSGPRPGSPCCVSASASFPGPSSRGW